MNLYGSGVLLLEQKEIFKKSNQILGYKNY